MLGHTAMGKKNCIGGERKVEVGGKHYENIIVTDLEGEVIAIITDHEIVEYADYKVILEPTK